MKLSRLYRDQRGVTLIDLIITIIILAIAVPPMVGVFITSTRNSTFGVTIARANHLASNLFEEIRSKRWDENTGAASATLGPDSGETRATYDDVDDFNGLDETPPKDSLGVTMSGSTGFRQEVCVRYVASNDLNNNTCPEAAATSNYKRIRVRVTDPEGRVTELVTLISSF
ncbi:MAG: mannose-sensitive agglutinin biogenesis protein MshD, MSHA pilin protein MshD [candidate division NC10 bacterium CSP1-5]|nr:MAG: mannose-sensitive agglutinin biogenesis protein MshD, MSHA pilin protein MshD [candidate division NC10 bacterium CSP1-5]